MQVDAAQLGVFEKHGVYSGELIMRQIDPAQLTRIVQHRLEKFRESIQVGQQVIRQFHAARVQFRTLGKRGSVTALRDTRKRRPLEETLHLAHLLVRVIQGETRERTLLSLSSGLGGRQGGKGRWVIFTWYTKVTSTRVQVLLRGTVQVVPDYPSTAYTINGVAGESLGSSLMFLFASSESKTRQERKKFRYSQTLYSLLVHHWTSSGRERTYKVHGGGGGAGLEEAHNSNKNSVVGWDAGFIFICQQPHPTTAVGHEKKKEKKSVFDMALIAAVGQRVRVRTLGASCGYSPMRRE